MTALSGWKDLLFVSRERRFFDYLVEQADATLAGIELLAEFLNHRPDGDEREASIERMSLLEKQGDDIRRHIISELRDTFVTPIDREDIYALSRAIDDILDYVDSTVKELVVYDVAPTDWMREMVDNLREAVMHLRDATANLVVDADEALAAMVGAKKMENQIEDLYRRANAALFDETDVHYIFKVREVYRHLSNCADRVDEAADILGAIVIKGNA
ncbi:MAG: DUF47 family protein [Alicyclobacillus sp.]|nr:DUF47 family protein [Alicyclobacillus sp.]